MSYIGSIMVVFRVNDKHDAISMFNDFQDEKIRALGSTASVFLPPHNIIDCEFRQQEVLLESFDADYDDVKHIIPMTFYVTIEHYHHVQHMLPVFRAISLNHPLVRVTAYWEGDECEEPESRGVYIFQNGMMRSSEFIILSEEEDNISDEQLLEKVRPARDWVPIPEK